MESFAAGIVPYILIEKEYYFLLGLEQSNCLWSGFVGGREKDETIQQTALREFNEETACIFQENLEWIQTQLTQTQPKIDITSTGKNVYIYFIEFPVETQEKIKDFINSKAFLNERCYKEKSILRWFTLHEIIQRTKRLYLPLKKMITLTFM